MTVHIVWHKRDLRVADHAVLASAARAGPVLPLYVVEPDYWALPDTSYRQYEFARASVDDLAAHYAALGGYLHVEQGDIIAVLQRLHAQYGDIKLCAHQETGNAWTYARDKRVHAWARANNIAFDEQMQFGIWRGPGLNRDKWAMMWDRFMAKPEAQLPDFISWAKRPDQAHDNAMPMADMLNLRHDGIADMQKAGRDAAETILYSFLHQRGRNYRTDMSSPILGAQGCSRLSPYIAMGSLSMREIYQAALLRQAELKGAQGYDAKAWRASLTSFIGRLHWHCHFMQKLELEPELEYLPMARSYAGVRDDYEPAHLAAYEQGRTGYPFVDACLRYVRRTGWLNFRMRAMLTSFASYNLWLPWQVSGDVLARLFVDYEPGIHWTQSQMQSGETGINTLRIYSPVKQGYDQDPHGDFIRANVPELAALDGKAVHEPWTRDMLSGEIIGDYPPPIVDHVASAKAARERIWAIKSTAEAKAEAKLVYAKHGSRKRPRRKAPRASAA